MKTLLTLVALAVALASSGCWWRAYPGGYGHEQRSSPGERDDRDDRGDRGEHRGDRGEHHGDGERH